MANLPESPSAYPTGIYQIETTDPVIGGVPNVSTGAGMSNIPHKQLADRTAWLKSQVDALLGDAFRVANSPRLLAANGHFRFGPGGLMVQWGQATISGATAVSFPAAFPTACFAVLVSDLATGTTGSGIHVVSVVQGTITQNGFTAVSKWVDDPTNLAVTAATFLALGH